MFATRIAVVGCACLALAGCKRESNSSRKGKAPIAQGAGATKPAPPPSLQANFAKNAPIIDGQLDDDVWADAETSTAFVHTLDGTPADFRAKARVLYDDENLYFAVEVQDDDLQATHDEHDDHLWEQDCVELMIDPDGDGKNYFELQISPKSVVFDTRYDSRRRPRPFGDIQWSSQLKQAVDVNGTLNDSKTDVGYTVEAALPFTALKAGATPTSAPSDGSEWRLNFYVMDSRAQGQRAAGWSPPLVPDFHVPSRFGTLNFKQIEQVEATVNKPRIRSLDPERSKRFQRKLDDTTPGQRLDRVHLKLICCDLSSKPLAVLLALEIALLFLRIPALRPTPNPASRKLSLR